MLNLAPLLLSAAPLLAQDAAPEPPSDLFQRVVVIGASASAGFGLSTELKARVRLGAVLACALPENAGEVHDLGTAAFFSSPAEYGERLVTAAIEEQPTLVVGVDFLFWYAFGTRPDAARPELFERGLAELERLECPILLGDLPDVSHALEGKGPFGRPLLSPNHLPPASMLASFNARLGEWADGRANVTIAPLAAYLSRVRDGQDVELRGNRWAPASLEAMTQEDRLHPTVEGTAAISILLLDALVGDRDDIDADSVRWKLSGILQRLMAATAEERSERLDKERRRDERRRARDKRRREEEGAGGLSAWWTPRRAG